MRSVASVSLLAHCALETTTLATLWKLTRRDLQVFGFTDHDSNILFNGISYEAESGVTASQVSSAADLSVDNLEVQGLITSAVITEEDLEAGVWDGAELVVSQVNYMDLTQGELLLRVGELGHVGKRGSEFIAEARGLMDKLQKQITRSYLPACDADLGDARCGVNLVPFTFSLTVTAVTSNSLFTDTALVQAADYFSYGIVTWLTGLNAGRAMEIKTHAVGGVFTLQIPMAREIVIGDTATVVAGCDKLFATCIAKFNNVVNFRGFPHVPGIDDLLTPGGG